MESMRRRQLEARRLSESSPIAGLGTYQVMRPSRGREVLAPRNAPPRPSRLGNGSDAFGLIAADRVVEDVPLPPPRPRALPPRAEDRTMIVAQRLYRAEIAPPPSLDRRGNRWFLPLGLAAVISTVLITLALYLR